MPSIKERVQAGVAYLDERGPEGWRQRVDPNTLHIASGDRCVLGQVYGDFVGGYLVLGLNRRERAGLGFDASDQWPMSEWYDQCVQLTQEWVRTLKAGS